VDDDAAVEADAAEATQEPVATAEDVPEANIVNLDDDIVDLGGVPSRISSVLVPAAANDGSLVVNPRCVRLRRVPEVPLMIFCAAGRATFARTAAWNA
jgi:hypothetical protein